MNDAFKKNFIKSGMTMYQLSAKTGIPYTTINKLIHDRLDINKVSAEAIYKISVVLETSMPDILNHIEIMNNATGHCGKIKYKWVCEEAKPPYIVFLYNGMEVEIDMEDNFNKASERRYYDYFAQMAIEQYIENVKFEESIKEDLNAALFSQA